MKNSKTYLKTNKKTYLFFLIGITVLISSVLCSLCIGSSDISVNQLIHMLFNPSQSGIERNIFTYVRLPRTIACILAGAGLSVSGAILQKVLANPLASPGIIGVNAGAGLGVVVCCALGAVSGRMFAASAFIGSLLALILITSASYRTKASKTTVILGGVAVNGILNALSEAISSLNSNAAIMSAEFRVGGFSSVSYIKLIPAGIIICISLLFVFTLCNELDVLTLGDDTAQGLGMSVRKTKNIFLLLASLLAGASVSFAGLLGFVGLIIPHLVRHFTGSDSKKVLFGSCIYGASVLTFSDLAARTLFAPYELPVGIITSLVGGPVFILLLIRKKGGHSHY